MPPGLTRVARRSDGHPVSKPWALGALGALRALGTASLKMDSAGETWHISKVLASFSALAWFQFVMHQII
jgi:hypothetical protein